MEFEFFFHLKSFSLSFPRDPDKRKKKEKPTYMCPSDTTLSEEDAYMHKAMEVLFLCDGHIKPMFVYF